MSSARSWVSISTSTADQKCLVAHVDDDDDLSSDSTDTEVYKRRHKCALNLLITLLSISFLTLLLSLILPWGDTPYNPRMMADLERFAADGTKIVHICKFKQHWNCPPGFPPFLCTPGPGTGGFPDVGYVMHHMGIMIGIAKPDGTPQGYVQLDYGHYGLLFTVQHTPGLPITIPWGQHCKYWCGNVTADKQDPQFLATLFDNWRGRGYNGYFFNCFEFTDQVWDYYSPVGERCGPENLPQYVEVPANISMS